VLFLEGGLNGMELTVGGKPLDRGHLTSVGLDSEHGAGLDRRAVNQDGARTTTSRVASNVGGREPQIVSQPVNEETPGLDFGRNLL
jgi:hypothetical protein